MSRARWWVLLGCAALVVGGFLLTRGRDDGTQAAIPVRTADVRDGMPGLVTIERTGARRVEVRPAWAAFSRGTPRTGVAIVLDVGGPRTFSFRSWTAPGLRGWKATAAPRGGRDVEVRSLGTLRDRDVVRPRGWVVEWSDGTTVERRASVSLRVAQSPVKRPWDVTRPAGASWETSSSLGQCDDAPGSDDCGRMPKEPAADTVP